MLCLIGVGLRGDFCPDLVCPPFVFDDNVFQPSFKRSLEFLPDININININIDLLISYKVHRSLSKGTHLTAFALIVYGR